MFHTHTNTRPLNHSLTHTLTHHSLSLASLWCPLVSAAFAWQAWHNVHWQGVGCTPWRPSGVPLASLWRPSGAPWSPPLLRRRRGPTCIGKGSHVRPGVPLASLWCPLVSAAFAWQAWTNVHWQGVGCTPWLASLWRPSGAIWSPRLLRGRRGTPCIGKGSDVRPGVPLASLWRPSGVPLASLWCPLVSAAFAWQAWHNVHCQGVGCTPWRPLGSAALSVPFAWQAWDNLQCQGARGAD